MIEVHSLPKKAQHCILVKEDKSPVTCIASTSSSSMIKNTIMATHSEGTLEFWHVTSNQILFQKKVPNLQFSMVSSYKAAKSVPTATGT
jgi:hypothetical protein